MSWQDTVLTDEQIRIIYGETRYILNQYPPDTPYWKILKAQQKRLAETQAEASYKAGYEAGKQDCEATHFKPDWKVNIKDIQDEAFRAGQKDVIEEACKHQRDNDRLEYGKLAVLLTHEVGFKEKAQKRIKELEARIKELEEALANQKEG